jgi:hypothetical protein
LTHFLTNFPGIISGSLVSIVSAGYLGATLCNRSLYGETAENEELSLLIEERFGQFLQEQLNGQQVLVRERQYYPYAWGDRSVPSSIAVITLPENLRRLDLDAFGYLLKVEASALKLHSPALTALMLSVTTTPFAVSWWLSDPYGPLGLLAGAVGVFATCFFSQYLSRLAYENANEHATDEELKAGLCYMLADQELMLEDRMISKLARLCSNSSGDYFFNWKCALSLRISKIMQALDERNISFLPDDPDVMIRISRLKGLISHCIRRGTS